MTTILSIALAVVIYTSWTRVQYLKGYILGLKSTHAELDREKMDVIARQSKLIADQNDLIDRLMQPDIDPQAIVDKILNEKNK